MEGQGVTTNDTDQVFKDINAVFLEVEGIFRNLATDHPRMRTLWDPDLAAPVYLAEESQELITDWPSMDRYFALTAEVLSMVRARYQLQSVVPLGGDLVTAYCRMEWQGVMPPDPDRIGGYVRVIAVLRKTAPGWRFVSYVEAPMAPIMYIRDLYKLVAKVSTIE
jgi:hypothetical protein